MAHYLVTGGAGFIGSHLTEELTRQGHRVRVADSLVTGKRSNLDHINGIEFLEGDLADLDVARKAVDGCDYVLHQAAIPSVPRSVADPMTSHRANVDATVNVLLAARDARVKRLVFAGSSAAYGDTPTLPKREDMPSNPMSPYALQKVIGEQYLQMFTRLYGLETVSIRYFNVFGPRQDPASPYSGVISVFATALLDNRPPTIYGDGEQTRDFTYVANVVRGAGRQRRGHQRGHGRPHFSESAVRGDAPLDRHRCDAQVHRDAGGRRPRLPGGHREGAHAARLRAARVLRRRPREDRGLVSHRRHRRHSIKSVCRGQAVNP
jgi:nucleoside-diphosphate-sugar epimerase